MHASAACTERRTAYTRAAYLLFSAPTLTARVSEQFVGRNRGAFAITMSHCSAEVGVVWTHTGCWPGECNGNPITSSTRQAPPHTCARGRCWAVDSKGGRPGGQTTLPIVTVWIGSKRRASTCRALDVDHHASTLRARTWLQNLRRTTHVRHVPQRVPRYLSFLLLFTANPSLVSHRLSSIPICTCQ